MLEAAKGGIEENAVKYIDLQLRYHFGMSRQELEELPDEDWAEHWAILQDIREQEAKSNQPFAQR